LEHYELKAGKGCHVFFGARSYEELLSEILEWWSGIRKETKTMEAITFTVDRNGKNAMVHWNYLTKEMKEKLDRILLTPQPLPPIKPGSVSGN
jgi:hypothetical protein